ncbi:ribonuclease E/G [Jannaschia seohaensis]|uniref:Ribonuclease, Rne/Rng family n=1 Tax=Jannaschia seohaensis TaxID=475081 RepID=A0A2Y9B6K3_9RHOB|nr:ribonuclease E/G [Jannaschia seohaensis]PWJ15000.1 Rne/Rng family ribonuclease [Jannaschia seohaensis]SSA49849.1 ribonuclease, Rne/Rng family [Jannaschia seohaensis]
MSTDQIVLGLHDGRPAAAWLRDGRLHDLLIDPKGDGPRPGAVYRAVCDRPVKGQGGMFVKLPDGLSGWHRNAKGLKPGQEILVQVSGHAEPGKAVPVTDRVLFKSQLCIVTPDAPGVNVARSVKDEDTRERLLEIAHDRLPETRGRIGLILRSAAALADPDDIEADIDETWAVAQSVLQDRGSGPEHLLDGPDAQMQAWREWPKAPVVEDWGIVLDHLDALRSPRVTLGPVTVWIEPTRALVAVDVNTPETGAGGLRANLAMVKELPRQLRLRGLGGQIVLDLAPMPKKDRRGFEAALRAAFRDDPVETSLIGWTPLGHFELTRRRERIPLEELL